jgi:DNA polymerase I-like protein with 3'-5' exonuclease and polymerase domains
MILYHDEIQSSVAAKDVDAYKQVLHDALKSTDDYYKIKCRNDIEIKTGSNWRDCH